MKRRLSAPSSAIAFLDVIACGFGAIVLLVLILPVGTVGEPQESHVFGLLAAQGAKIRDAEFDNATSQLQIDSLRASIAAIKGMEVLQNGNDEGLALRIAQMQRQMQETRSRADSLERKLATKVTSTGIDTQGLSKDLYGIPIDSDYLVFVIDTSGSMGQIWPRVSAKVTEVLKTYPNLLGFQIMSDQGEFLRQSRTQWLSPSRGNVEAVMRDFKKWKSYSNSSPAEGVRVAMDKLYKRGQKMALFVIGDDYTGVEFDSFLEEIEDIKARAGGAGQLRIHSMGFYNEMYTQYPERFVLLMQMLTFNHGGAFIYFGNPQPSTVVIARGQQRRSKD